MFQIIFLAAAAVLTAVDQILKQIVVHHIALGQEIPIIGHFLVLTHSTNDGVVWGLFSGVRWITLGLTTVMVILFLYVMLTRRFGGSKLFNIGGTLVVAGGVGNLIDRFISGRVVDYIYVKIINFPVFNFADCCVVIGAFLVLVFFFFFYSDQKHQKLRSDEKESDGHA